MLCASPRARYVVHCPLLSLPAIVWSLMLLLMQIATRFCFLPPRHPSSAPPHTSLLGVVDGVSLEGMEGICLCWLDDTIGQTAEKIISFQFLDLAVNYFLMLQQISIPPQTCWICGQFITCTAQNACLKTNGICQVFLSIFRHNKTFVHRRFGCWQALRDQWLGTYCTRSQASQHTSQPTTQRNTNKTKTSAWPPPPQLLTSIGINFKGESDCHVFCDDSWPK